MACDVCKQDGFFEAYDVEVKYKGPVIMTVSAITGEFVITAPPGSEDVANEVLEAVIRFGGKGGPRHTPKREFKFKKSICPDCISGMKERQK